MDNLKGRYFNINRKLLTFVGLWPYETKMQKTFHRIFTIIALVIFFTPHLISAFVHYENMDRLMMSVLFFLIGIVIIAKMFGLIIAEDNLKEMLTSIVDNWVTVQNDNEKNILQNYSEWGRRVSIFYCLSMTSFSGTMLIVPLIPKIFDQIDPLIQPRQNIYMLQGEFFIDRDTHFTLLYCWDAITIIITTIVTISVDTMYMVCTQHCCALYAIVRHRLLKLRGNVHDYNSSTTEANDSYDWIIRTMQLHGKSLIFTSVLNDAYSISLLLILIVNLILIPLDSVAVLIHLKTPLNALPYILLAVALSLHLLILFWPGQRVLDHGLDLWDSAYYNQWYATSVRTRKLLVIFMLRCSQPASISAGNLLLMNFENYSMIMRTAVSYTTVVASFR